MTAEEIDVAKNCKMCGTQNGDDIQFCAACGSALDGDQGQVKRGAQRPAGTAAKTMMFGVAPQVGAAAAPTVAQPVVAAAPAAPAAPAAKVAPRTMLGVPAVTAQTVAQPQAPVAQPAPMVKLAPAPAAAKPAAPSEAWRDKRTVLGMPAVTGEATQQATSQPPAPAAPAVAPAAPAASAPHPETRPLEPVERKPAASPRMPTQRVLDPIDEPPPRRADWDDDDEPLPRKKGGKGLLIAAIAAGGVIFLALAGAGIWFFVLKGGGAASPKALNQICRVTVDQTGLVAAAPSFLVTFEVAEGFQLSVQGRPAPLVAGGRFVLPVALSQIAGAVQSGDTLIYTIPYQVTDGDGMIQQGQHAVTIPLTKLQIDRPAANATVAMESVPVSGVTEEGAVVTVDGAAVGVTASAFHSAVPLPAIGEQSIVIMARAPGKAPRTETIKITRVQSQDAAIAKWREDLGAAIDYPTLARDPALQVGKKVVYRGRVTKIVTERGVTIFLLYVGTGCPKASRCAVYVAYRGETDAGTYSTVDVFGKVTGTSNVQFLGSEPEPVPALEADYVVRVEDDASAKRKRR